TAISENLPHVPEREPRQRTTRSAIDNLRPRPPRELLNEHLVPSWLRVLERLRMGTEVMRTTHIEPEQKNPGSAQHGSHPAPLKAAIRPRLINRIGRQHLDPRCCERAILL